MIANNQCDLILIGRYYRESMTNFICVVTYVDRKKNIVTVLYCDGSVENLTVDTFLASFDMVKDSKKEEQTKYMSFMVEMNTLERSYNE